MIEYTAMAESSSVILTVYFLGSGFFLENRGHNINPDFTAFKVKLYKNLMVIVFVSFFITIILSIFQFFYSIVAMIISFAILLIALYFLLSLSEMQTTIEGFEEFINKNFKSGKN